MTPAERPRDEAIRSALGRILDSKSFQRSERLRAFLTYVVEKEIAGEAGQLKGYSIAVDVFGRSQAFDADSDPLVRVHAGKLRKLLKGFYDAEGAGEVWQISVPKGTYVPEYRRLRGPAAELPEGPAMAARDRPSERRPAWQPPPFSSPWAVLTVLPLLLFTPLPSPKVALDFGAEAKLVNGPMAAVRGLPSAGFAVDGEHGTAGHFATLLRAAALRYKTLAAADVAGTPHPAGSLNPALAFSVKVAWHDSPEPGLRVTLSHNGERVPLRQDFIGAQQLANESDLLYQTTSLAAQLFALDGEIYAHAATEGLQSTLMRCMVTTARYKKLLTRGAFQEAWTCQQELAPLKGDEPLFILSSKKSNELFSH
ncbi:hypothetical protein [Sinorhizobium americanum]|uniref:Uncharacterized protein n=1 Tax=Sinorhizobium americanum TaxID=194963 RepID=A0A1L3LNJ3_9HYPH|nr:hypothetical protein [Sinorhizobium americanum]APG91649.1 hypothetical protein SAMCFNEI73_Ch2370 [Sinorhizobium americanum]OAP47626.1 hypothetical protein ATC00_23580 [Sinorhizobium americanum]